MDSRPFDRPEMAGKYSQCLLSWHTYQGILSTRAGNTHWRSREHYTEEYRRRTEPVRRSNRLPLAAREEGADEITARDRQEQARGVLEVIMDGKG